MTFYAFGVNHLRAPVEVREAFALDETSKRAVHERVRLGPDSELLLLSTCNRTEAYLFGTKHDVEVVRAALSEAAAREWPGDVSFFCEDEEAVRHVLEVSAGLKSLVLGDAQIFSQLKEAYRIAVEEQRVDTTMHRLLHTAFRTAKRIINETDLTSGAASIPYQAVEAAKAHFLARYGKSLASLKGLVVGSGSMGLLAAEALRLEGLEELAFTNRSQERGRDAASRFHASYVPWNARHGTAAESDVVIVATSAQEPVLFVDDFSSLRRRDDVLIIDISVPRNVEAGVAALPGIHVINVDQLNDVTEDTQEVRTSAVPDARRIVDEMLSEFVAWVFHHQALQPAIRAIAETFEAIRAQEVHRHHQRFSDADRAELDRITRSIIQKLLAVPIVRLKSVDPESIDFVHGVRLLHALFRRQNCEDEGETTDAGPVPRQDYPVEAPREDCPIEPQLPDEHVSDSSAEMDLDDVLRLFSDRDAGRSL